LRWRVAEVDTDVFEPGSISYPSSKEHKEDSVRRIGAEINRSGNEFA
jgi:hypothetical protein